MYLMHSIYIDLRNVALTGKEVACSLCCHCYPTRQSYWDHCYRNACTFHHPYMNILICVCVHGGSGMVGGEDYRLATSNLCTSLQPPKLELREDWLRTLDRGRNLPEWLADTTRE